MLRLNPSRGAYNAYIYAFQKEQFDRHLARQPIEQEIPIPAEAQDPPKKSNRERLKEITDSIENGIQDVFTSGKYQQYLQTMSRFHRYSFNNTTNATASLSKNGWNSVIIRRSIRSSYQRPLNWSFTNSSNRGRVN